MMMAPRDGFTTVKGLKLHYLGWGIPARETVLFLHGFACCAASFSDLGRKLGQKFHVIALDSRGHGDSEWSDLSAYSLDDHATDVAVVVDKLKLAPVNIIGHSMGSAVAQRYAARHPEQIKSLVLIDNGPVLGEKALQRTKARPPAKEKYSSLEEVAEYLKYNDRQAPHDVMLKEAAWLTHRSSDGSYSWKAHRYGGGLPPLSPDDINKRWEIVRSIKNKTLIIRGGESEVFEAETARRMAATIPGARLVEITGAGHYVHRDKPIEFEKTISDFLGV